MAEKAPWDDEKAPWDTDEKAPWDENKGDIGRGTAFGVGVNKGVTAGFVDELQGLEAASGLPRWAIGHWPVGAARLGYEALTGRGTATEEYEKARDASRAQQKQAHEQYPYTTGAGELTGAVGSIPLLPGAGFVKGAGLASRMGQGAVAGAEYGALSGAGEGEGAAGSAVGAGVGGLLGGGLGAAAPVAGAAVAKAYDAFGRPIERFLRSKVRGVDEEAASRVASAIARGEQSVAEGARGLTRAEFEASVARGEPAMVADIAGTPGQALARSVANISPEARATLESAAGERFHSQAPRLAEEMRQMMPGGVNAAKSRAQLEAEYNAQRIPAYENAYEAGDRPIWSPTLERLTTAPVIRDAMKAAEMNWKNWQVHDGFGGMNAPEVVGGGLIRYHGNGIPTYPNLQFWDYTARQIAGMTQEAVRAGNNTKASLYGGLEKQLKAELDKQVPEFAAARGVARDFFGASNASNAGELAATTNRIKGKIIDGPMLKQQMAKMTPAERDLFIEGYIEAKAKHIAGLSDTTDVAKRLFNGPLDRQKFTAVAGPDAAKKLEAMVYRERIFNGLRDALGNSTTVRQMLEMGLLTGAGGAGSALGSYYDSRGSVSGSLLGALGGTALGAIGLRRGPMDVARTGLEKIAALSDKDVAKRIAEMLTSQDLTQVNKALEVAARNAKVMNALKDAATRIAAVTGAQKGQEPLRARGGSVTPGSREDIQDWHSSIQRARQNLDREDPNIPYEPPTDFERRWGPDDPYTPSVTPGRHEQYRPPGRRAADGGVMDLGTEVLFPKDREKSDEFLRKLGETWPVQAVKDVGRALTLPERVYRGEASPDDPRETTNFVQSIATGPIATAARRSGAGIFGGRLGAGAKAEAMDAADQALVRGADPMDVYKESGMFRGPEGKMRFEISDQAARLKTENLKQHGNVSGEPWYQSPGGFMNDMKLSDFIDHPELFAHYPELKDMPLTFPGFNFGTLGWYSPELGKMAIAGGKASDMLSTVLHELQHAVQNKEGFAHGSNVQKWVKDPEGLKRLNDALSDARRVEEAFWNEPEVIAKLKSSPALSGLFKDRFEWMKDEVAVAKFLVQTEKFNMGTPDAAKPALAEFKKLFPEFMETIKIGAEAKKLATDVEKAAFERYKKSFGETEARIVQERQELPASERRKIYPYHGGEFKATYPENMVKGEYVEVPPGRRRGGSVLVPRRK